MTCAEFQDRFSDYFDGKGDPRSMTEASAHLDGCADCRRYRDVVERGIRVLRTVPGPSVPGDFLPRLQHRIYHLKDRAGLWQREAAGSASTTTTTTALVIAMLVAAAAWSPVLVQAPEVTLDPIVVSEPEPRFVGVRTPSLRTVPEQPVGAMHRGLWDDPLLLTRYSPLSSALDARTAMRRADFE